MQRFEVTMCLADGSGEDQRLQFALEPGQQVVFGRSLDVDIVIPDQNRKVSSRHGRIACLPDGSLRSYDLASLNGTYLHGEPLDTDVGGDLADGDRLRVGDFELVISLLEPGTGGATAPVPRMHAPPAAEPHHRVAGGGRPAATSAAADPELATGPLIEAIERVYAESLQQDTDARTEKVAARLERDLATLPAPRRDRLTAALLGRYCLPTVCLETVQPEDQAAEPHTDAHEPHPESPSTGPEAAPPASPAHATTTATDRAALVTGSVDHLQLLALRLVPGVELATDVQRSTFMALVAQVCEATLASLARGIEGRSVFGQEFGAEVTVVFQRSTNPLKGMNHEELQRYLLDWSHPVPAESRRHYLDGVLEDLHEHQVGVLAGVEEAISGVLSRLAPERVEGIAAQQKVKGWTAAARSWHAYLQLHQELAEERSKLFHELISPAIQKGYLHRHGDRDESETP